MADRQGIQAGADALRNLADGGHQCRRIWGRATVGPGPGLVRFDSDGVPDPGGECAAGNVWAADPEDIAALVLEAAGHPAGCGPPTVVAADGLPAAVPRRGSDAQIASVVCGDQAAKATTQIGFTDRHAYLVPDDEDTPAGDAAARFDRAAVDELLIAMPEQEACHVRDLLAAHDGQVRRAVSLATDLSKAVNRADRAEQQVQQHDQWCQDVRHMARLSQALLTRDDNNPQRGTVDQVLDLLLRGDTARNQLATVAEHLNQHGLWDGDDSTAAAAVRLIQHGQAAVRLIQHGQAAQQELTRLGDTIARRYPGEPARGDVRAHRAPADVALELLERWRDDSATMHRMVAGIAQALGGPETGDPLHLTLRLVQEWQRLSEAVDSCDPEQRALRMAQENNRLVEALRLTVEYVGTDTLKPQPGWSWFDALSDIVPGLAQVFVDHHERVVKPSLQRARERENRARRVLDAYDRGLITVPRDDTPQPDLGGIDIGLVGDVRKLGRRWGELGVALVAAQLTDTEQLLSRLQASLTDDSQPPAGGKPCRPVPYGSDPGKDTP